MSFKPTTLLAVAGALFTAAIVPNADGAIVAVDSSFFVAGVFDGSRTTVGTTGSGGGLVWNPDDGAWSDGGFSIGWKITDNGSDFTYEYTITTPSGGDAKLSHWNLASSETDADGGSLQTHWQSVFPNGEVKLHEEHQGNPGMPGELYGVKLQSSQQVSTTIAFTTSQIPVWGDFYAKDGGGNGDDAVWAHNSGFGQMADDTNDYIEWIPRPDGVIRPPDEGDPLVPEPASILVWSSLTALVGFLLYRRRRR